MKRSVVCTLLLTLLYFVPQAQIGIYQKVIADSSFSKDYRFRSLPNYSLYNGITNIISPTTGTYDLTTPPGTTAQRPVVPSGKVILRYNTDSAALEYGNDAQLWKTVAAGSVQSFDTTSIANFGLKVRSLFSATSPLQYNAVTGNIQIPQATSSQAGYLASADWVVFNSKLPDPGSNGIVVRTALGITASRQLVASSTNISLVNATGVSGNPSIDLNDTLSLRQLYLPYIPTALSSSDSALVLNRTTGLLEVRAVAAAGSIIDIRRRSGTDTVEQFKNGTWQFALIDSLGGTLVNNGLSRSLDTIQLGGALTKNTTIAAGLLGLTITASGSTTPLSITSSGTANGLFVNSAPGTGVGINVQSNNQNAIQAISLGSGYGISAFSSSNYGGYLSTSSGAAALAIESNHSSTNTARTVLQIKRYTSGTAANDISGRLEFITEPASGTVDVTSGYIESGWEDATFATRKSFMGLHTVLNGVSSKVLNMGSSGQMTLPLYPSLTAQVDTTTHKPLAIDGSGNVVKMAGWAGSGGGGTPAGADREIQINNSGAFGAHTGTLITTDGTIVSDSVRSLRHTFRGDSTSYDKILFSKSSLRDGATTGFIGFGETHNDYEPATINNTLGFGIGTPGIGGTHSMYLQMENNWTPFIGAPYRQKEYYLHIIYPSGLHLRPMS